MKRTKKVTVPEPCSEKWGRMAPMEQGRHCSVCSTLAVDFTNYTVPELVEYLMSVKGKVCGRFSNGQLNKPVAIPVQHSASFLQKALVGGAIAATLSLNASAQYVTGQATVSNKGIQSGVVIHPVIRGTLVDSKTKKGLRYLRVNVQGTGYGMETDSLGNFAFTVPDELANKPITFEVQEYPYAKNTTTVKAGKYPSSLKIALKQTPESKRRRGSVGGCPSF